MSLVLLPVFGSLICVSTSEEQVVTATAKITLTVIAPPAIVVTSTDHDSGIFLTSQAGGGAIALHTSGNVAVILDFFGQPKTSAPNHSSQESGKVLTLKDLAGVSKVSIVYLGN